MRRQTEVGLATCCPAPEDTAGALSAQRFARRAEKHRAVAAGIEDAQQLSWLTPKAGRRAHDGCAVVAWPVGLEVFALNVCSCLPEAKASILHEPESLAFPFLRDKLLRINCGRSGTKVKVII